jgi:hypothetical protein
MKLKGYWARIVKKTGSGRSKFWCIAKNEKISLQTGK